MKIRTKFIAVYKISDMMLVTRVRFSTDVEFEYAFIPVLRSPLPVHRINFPFYFTKGATNYSLFSTNYDLFTPCPYS